MMKRFFALTAVTTLMIASFAACSKDKPDNDNAQTTPTSAPEDLVISGDDSDYIALGGYFTGENTSLSVFISGSSLYVNGILFQEDDSSPLILTGPLSFSEGTSFVYTKENDQLTLTFAADSMTITVDKGDTYTAFSGKYNRTNNTVAESGSVVPKKDSALESVGRIALTYYMSGGEGSSTYSFDRTSAAFDNASMLKFISIYADLFLTGEAEPVPDVSAEYLCYAFTEAELNNLLLAATAGAFTVENLSVTGSDIVLQNGIYYVPCPGTYAGGIASSYTDENPEMLAENLLLDAVVIKIDGTRYDMEMTVSTSRNEAAGTAGVQIDSVQYKITR